MLADVYFIVNQNSVPHQQEDSVTKYRPIVTSQTASFFHRF